MNEQLPKNLGAKILSIAIKSYIDDIMKNHLNDVTPKMRKALDFYNRIANQLRETGNIDYNTTNGGHISGILEVLADGIFQYSNKAKQTSTPSFVVVMLDWAGDTIRGIGLQIKTNTARNNANPISIDLPEEIAFLFDTMQPGSF